MDEAIVDKVAEAIWSSEANKRVVSWATMDERVRELWREDARRAIVVLTKLGKVNV